MTIGARLKAERNRLGMSQARFAEIGGVVKGTQISYEKNERMPDASYLAKLSKVPVDVLYVITSQRNTEMPGLVFLDPKQQALISSYDAASEQDKKIIEGVARLAAQPLIARRSDGP